jgi:two-component system osmolarity sensor histidine kinase EnvZ
VSLLTRSFLLIALLIVTAVVASFAIYRAHSLEPRANELAQQTVSTVNLTRAALVNADPFRRRDLLVELNETEGLRVFPATASEKLEALPADPLLDRVAPRVRAALGAPTRFASERDGEDGFWVSFFIDDDEFWVMLPWERFEPEFGLEWAYWGLALLALALAGAWLIASRMARPLAALTRAAGRLGRGEAHQPLAEEGVRELRLLSAAFNRMASSLETMERDRAMVLAGISHDLRTPLSRLRLALEMSGASPAAAQAIETDVEEIDAVIGQFLDFARGEDEAKQEHDLRGVLEDLAEHYTRLGKKIAFEGKDYLLFKFARMGVRRAIGNLIDNALRYAGEPIEVAGFREGGFAVVEVRDRGPGIPAGDAERLKRPFTRLDRSRGAHGGSGLGLAIVERLARAHGGALELLPREGGGLVARLTLRF